MAKRLVYSVTIATGRIGGRVARGLLEAGHEVRAIGRDEGRLRPLVELGARAVVGDVADQSFTERAFAGADAALLIVKSDRDSAEFGADFHRMGASYAGAARATGLKNAVFLSAMGAHDPSLRGLIGVHTDVERMLDEVSTLKVVHLRPASFIENLFYFMPLMRARGVLASPIATGAPMDWSTTRDAADVALRTLLEVPFRASRSIEVRGAQPAAMDELARAIGARLGRSFPAEQLERTSDIEAMVAGGSSRDFATRMNDTWEIFSRRLVRDETTTPVITPSRIDDFIGADLVPALEAAARDDRPGGGDWVSG
jgi:uncharacterized protein YbjT (DUF2867 family)